MPAARFAQYPIISLIPPAIVVVVVVVVAVTAIVIAWCQVKLWRVSVATAAAVVVAAVVVVAVEVVVVVVVVVTVMVVGTAWRQALEEGACVATTVGQCTGLMRWYTICMNSLLLQY